MKIVNIVATVTLSNPLNLQAVAKALPDSEFCRSSACWLKYRLGQEKQYIAFYKSGKFLIVGAKSESEITEVSLKVVRLLCNMGVQVIIKEVEIHNIVAQDSMILEHSLEDIIHVLDPTKASFEPEQFPGLVYKDWGVSFLLFSSGKIIITGVKNVSDMMSLCSKFKNHVNASFV